MVQRAIHMNVMGEDWNKPPPHRLTVAGADGDMMMKASTLAALLVPVCLACSASAQAKLSPFAPDQPVTTISLEDTTIDSALSGAMLESSYFNAPQPPFASGRVLQCLQTNIVFKKTRIARSCD
jgi:hypothetical protein